MDVPLTGWQNLCARLHALWFVVRARRELVWAVNALSTATLEPHGCRIQLHLFPQSSRFMTSAFCTPLDEDGNAWGTLHRVDCSGSAVETVWCGDYSTIGPDGTVTH